MTASPPETRGRAGGEGRSPRARDDRWVCSTPRSRSRPDPRVRDVRPGVRDVQRFAGLFPDRRGPRRRECRISGESEPCGRGPLRSSDRLLPQPVALPPAESHPRTRSTRFARNASQEGRAQRPSYRRPYALVGRGNGEGAEAPAKTSPLTWQRMRDLAQIVRPFRDLAMLDAGDDAGYVKTFNMSLRPRPSTSGVRACCSLGYRNQGQVPHTGDRNGHSYVNSTLGREPDSSSWRPV